jgi:LppM domain
MMRRVLTAMIALPLSVSLAGCLFEAKINAQGGGTGTVTQSLNKKDALPKLEAQLKSSSVKVQSSKLSSDGKLGIVTVAFDDIAALHTTEYFKLVTFSRKDGKEKGTKTITAKYENPKPGPVPDSIAKVFGNEIKVVTTFPGEVTETNGEKNGDTVTWKWGISEFYQKKEVTLTATYKEKATGATSKSKSG